MSFKALALGSYENGKSEKRQMVKITRIATFLQERQEKSLGTK